VRAPLLQRKCACGGPAGFSGGCEACGEKRFGLQRRAAGLDAGIVPPIVHEVLRSPGAPLEPGTRAFMEPRFGHDFGHVRVHADTHTAQSADAVNALAYTVGRDVAFAAGRHTPHTDQGRRLLAHELAHVLQQDAIARFRSADEALTLGDPDDPAERQADRVSGQTTADPPIYLEANGVSESPSRHFGPNRNLLAQDSSNVLRPFVQRKPSASGNLAFAALAAEFDVKPPDSTSNEPDRSRPSPSATDAGSASPSTAENVSKPICEPNTPLTWQEFQAKPSEGLTIDKERGQLSETQAETACGIVPAYQVVDDALVPMTLGAKFWAEQSWGLSIYKFPDDPFENGLIKDVGYCKESFADGSKGPYSFMLFNCANLPWPKAKDAQGCESDKVMNQYMKIREERSQEVLKHEQGHFDITCAMATNGTAALSLFPVDDVINRKNCADKYEKKEQELQLSYDSEAGRSFNTCDAQKRWNDKLNAGLPTERNLCR